MHAPALRTRLAAPLLGIRPDELIVDCFAGGGGASLGIFWATGRHPDIAINHDREALAMHEANHPSTRHYREDIWKVSPYEVCGDIEQSRRVVHKAATAATTSRGCATPSRKCSSETVSRNTRVSVAKVGLLHASPDCTHHSRAKGGKPRNKKIRSLAWVCVRWAVAVRPRIITMENVEEFVGWGGLLPNGKPDPARAGRNFRAFVTRLRNLGYEVEWRTLRGCDFGAKTTRTRFFLIARCDGEDIRWPVPTHGKGRARPYGTTAECIDWTIPCPSIFQRRKPLAEKTQRRIARGIWRYILEAPKPYIVQTTTSVGERVVGAATLVQTGYGEREGQAPRALDLQKPLGTVVAGGGKHALVMAFLAKHYSARHPGEVQASAMTAPMGTITTADHHALVAAFCVKLRGTCRDGQRVDAPLHTISAGGLHHAEVRTLLLRYLESGERPGDLFASTGREPGIVRINGESYVIVDIGMRMLGPRELYRAQGFPDSYRVEDVTVECTNGRGVRQMKRLSQKAQIRMCGNSVCPHVEAAVIAANLRFAPVLAEAV